MTAPTVVSIVTEAEQGAAEILAAVDPALAAKIWAWFNQHSFTGFFGLAEKKLLQYVFTILFGTDPGTPVSGA